jgi:hypothetical protein
MPALVVAGIPYGKYQPIRGRSLIVAGWDVSIVPSIHAREAILDDTTCDKIEALATASGTGGHVLAFSTRSDRTQWSDRLRTYLRFRWLHASYLEYLPHRLDVFQARLEVEAGFESEWRRLVQPEDTGSPLLLPECAFTPKEYPKIWKEAAEVDPARPNADPVEALRRVERQIGGFRQIHRREGYWLDQRELRFNFTGPRHGRPVDDLWYWRYSWRVPDGFHFDVSQAKGREFYIVDRNGVRHTVPAKAYINLDCHGRRR